MKYSFSFLLAITLFIFGCQTGTEQNTDAQSAPATGQDDFQWQVDRFADVRVLRYQVPGFDKLSLDQKKLVYYLTEAGLAGRDIMYAMNYRHNLAIRQAMEGIFRTYKGDRNSEEWNALETYAKRLWFANGIHHHYSMNKFIPGFSREYFEGLLAETNTTLDHEVVIAMFDPQVDAKKVSLDASKDLVQGSAVNFYAPEVTQAEVEAFYAKMIDKSDPEPIWYGLNSRVVKMADGTIAEEVYAADGLYGPAIREMISWIEKAKGVAENEKQAEAFQLLIEYYRTGDLEKWDEYNIAWCETTGGDVDYITGFVEVYNDPLGYKGSYETIVQIKDFDASARMKVLAENAQWFEDNSTILDKHKKESVVGVTYHVVTVAGESGDASPATPIGVNLPNANWIRAKHGSKSVSLGNIIDAYDKASGPGMLSEFAHDEEEIERGKKYGSLADKLSTALHEVIGHASGQIEPGIGTPKQTLKNYASTIEEARADIVALYFIMDPKMEELGLVPSMDVGKAEYDGFISNGLLKQLRRIEPGEQIEESHMRNRALIANWVYEKGQAENIISKVVRDGKVYFNIIDYQKLRGLFGELLTELQRITSTGDFAAAQKLVESYGVQVDPEVHAQVLARVEKLNITPYSGFVNPKLVPVTNGDGEITEVRVEYPDNFVDQMLEYGEKYSFLKP